MIDYRRVIPVQQIDRDTTAGYCEAHGITMPQMVTKMRAGEADDHWLVQLAAYQREAVAHPMFVKKAGSEDWVPVP